MTFFVLGRQGVESYPQMTNLYLTNDLLEYKNVIGFKWKRFWPDWKLLSTSKIQSIHLKNFFLKYSLYEKKYHDIDKII